MLTLEQLRTQCDAAADADESTCAAYEDVRQVYGRYASELHMNDTANLMFSNHVMCVLKRIRSGEFVDEVPEELFSEIPERARQIAGDLLAGAFADAGATPNKTEVLMLATHIGAAMAEER